MTTSVTNLGRVAFVPKGVWNMGQTYSRLNVVYYAGNSYVAISNVPLNTAITNTSYWQLLAAKGDTGGVGLLADNFDASATYPVGAYCMNENNLYRFITAHPAPAWDSLEVEAVTANVFDPTQAYAIDDVAIYNNQYYIFTSAHTAGTDWDYGEVNLLTPETFTPTGEYTTGDYVVYNGALYRYTSDHYSGAWNSALVEMVTIGDELPNKADLSDIEDIEDALDGKQNTLTFDSTPTASSSNPVTSDGIKTALDSKQNTLTFDSTPTANSTNPVTSAGVKTALDNEILYFCSADSNAMVVNVATSAEIGRIIDSRITDDYVVLGCIFGSPGVVASYPTWESHDGYVAFTGTCYAATTADVKLGKKGN